MTAQITPNNPYIRNPIFSFIYTVNLDGRITQKTDEKDKEYYSRLIDNKKYSSELRDRFIFYGNSSIDLDFKYTEPTEYLQHFIDEHFLDKAVCGTWKLEKHEMLLNKNDVLRTKELNSHLNRTIDESSNNLQVSFFNQPKVEMFKTGAVSITIDFHITANGKPIRIGAEDCIKLIKYPNLVKHISIRKYLEQYEKKLEGEDIGPIPGVLNVLSSQICQVIFEKFIEKIQEDAVKSLISEKIKKERSVFSKFKGRRYHAKNETGTNRIPIYPYIGVLFNTFPSYADIASEDGSTRDRGCKLLFALANHTQAFLTNFQEPYEYLLRKDISRGKHDAIILERRGLVAAGSRSPSWDDFIENAYQTLMFSISSIIATTKSVSSFNKDIEEAISNQVSKIVTSEIRDRRFIRLSKKMKDINKVKSLISKARTLSPCEDISTNIIPYIRSRISYEGILRFRKFALDQVIELVHSRLENYGHFMRTEYDKISTKYKDTFNKSVLILTIVAVFIGINNFNYSNLTDFFSNFELTVLLFYSLFFILVIGILIILGTYKRE